MLEILDQLGRKVSPYPFPPKRIVSLVPSQTELLFHLGLESEIVGITRFCIHPGEKVKTKPKVGGTKNVSKEKVLALQPDLVFANKEENTAEVVEELQKFVPVFVSDVNNISSALEMIEMVGRITKTSQKADTLCTDIKQSFSELPNYKPLRTAYLIWKKPWMAVGGDTYINGIMALAGFDNAFSQASRYPEITMEQLRDANPELVLLSSEPYPFQEKDKKDFELLPNNCLISIVDGEAFSWYGNRMLQTPKYLQKLNEQIRINSAVN